MKKLTKNQIKKGAEEVSEALIKFFNLTSSDVIKNFLLFTFLFLFNVSVATHEVMGEVTSVTIPTISQEQLYIMSVKDKMEQSLVLEVGRYITDMAPESKLTPELIVEKCIEYETDIVFVLAQALLESHFGTRGKAATTNSVWNVGTYDDGQILYRYNTPDESLEPYLKLINNNYLINVSSKGDTIYKDISHLTQDKGYINYDGKRFASATGYENAMRKLMINIDVKTSINFYQEVLTMPNDMILSYFNPTAGQNFPERLLASR